MRVAIETPPLRDVPSQSTPSLNASRQPTRRSPAKPSSRRRARAAASARWRHAGGRNQRHSILQRATQTELDRKCHRLLPRRRQHVLLGCPPLTGGCKWRSRVPVATPATVVIAPSELRLFPTPFRRPHPQALFCASDSRWQSCRINNATDEQQERSHHGEWGSAWCDRVLR